VGAGERRGRNFEAECLRGLEVDHELELPGAVDRHVRGLGTLEDAAGIDADPSIGIGYVVAVADQAAGCRELTTRRDHRNRMPRRQHSELPDARRIKRIRADSHSMRPLLRERCERRVDFGYRAGFEDKQPPSESACAVLRGLLVERPFWIVWI